MKNKRIQLHHNELLDRDRIDSHINFVVIDGSRNIEGDQTITGTLTVGTEVLIDGRDPLRYSLMMVL